MDWYRKQAAQRHCVGIGKFASLAFTSRVLLRHPFPMLFSIPEYFLSTKWRYVLDSLTSSLYLVTTFPFIFFGTYVLLASLFSNLYLTNVDMTHMMKTPNVITPAQQSRANDGDAYFIYILGFFSIESMF